MRTIDSKKCIGCGKCVSDCVNQYLTLTDTECGQKRASFVERGRCLECGHCNAICPQGAVSGGKIVSGRADGDKLLALMARKRTVRKYIKDSIIAQDVLDKIIFAGQTAPTARNRRSARIVLIKESLPTLYESALDYLVADVQRAGTIDPLYAPTMKMDQNRDEVLWNAEYLVVFIGSPQDSIDAAIASERMQLEAEQLGVGTAYRGDMQIAINHVDGLRRMLEMRSNEEVLVSFAMGMTDTKYLRPAAKLNRKVVFK